MESREGQGSEAADLIAGVVENSMDAIVTTTVGGIVTSWNPAAAKIFGFSAQEMLGRSILTLIPSDRIDEEKLVSAAVTRGQRIPPFYTERVHRNRQRLHVSLTQSPLRDRAGRVVGSSTILRDITAVRKLEEQVGEMRRLESLGQLAAGFAHEFNNSLAIVLGYLGLAEVSARAAEQAAVADTLGKAAAAAQAAAMVTRQLMAFGRQQLLHLQPVDLAGLLREMAPELQGILGPKIEQVIELAAAPLICSGDAASLRQMIANLALNARDAMPTGGRFRLRLAGDDRVVNRAGAAGGATRYARLEVADTGRGIRPEHISRLFQPFFTTKPIGEGRGLGLAAAYGTAAQHEGWIEAESEWGTGTIFRVYLPLVAPKADPGPQPGEPAAAAEPAKAPCRILYIEDDEDVRRFISRALGLMGYEVYAAGEGREALRFWAELKDKIDLVVTDVMMPGEMDGLALVQHLRRERPDLKVLITTAYDEEVFGESGIRADMVLRKPYNLTRFNATVQSLLGRSAELAGQPSQ
jgi:two-component system cell cycle sensor histidine kinase/response regulator CckA